MKPTEIGLVVSPSRLFGAAQVLIGAMRSPGGFNSRVTMYVGPQRADGSVVPRAFTAEELLGAMDMLTRMGLVPVDSVDACPVDRGHVSSWMSPVDLVRRAIASA